MKSRMNDTEPDGLDRSPAEGVGFTVCLVSATLAMFGAVVLSALM